MSACNLAPHGVCGRQNSSALRGVSCSPAPEKVFLHVAGGNRTAVVLGLEVGGRPGLSAQAQCGRRVFVRGRQEGQGVRQRDVMARWG